MQENLPNSGFLGERTLSNGLSYSLLNGFIAEHQARKACISISLNKGNFDADGYPEGLAHLFEHMLFSSSKHYQHADSLDKHLFSFSGQVNAWTQDQSTNIQLNCNQSGFMQACDILFDRIVSPLFQIEDIKREIKAIEAEFQSKKSDPIRKLISVQKATSNPLHPFSKFTSGNAETLNKFTPQNLQTMLREYHQKVMVGHNLFVCVGIGEKTDIEQFRNEIEKKLRLISPSTHSINSNKIPSENSTQIIYNKEHLGKLILVEQEKLPGQMILTFLVKQKDVPKDAKVDLCKEQQKRSASYLILSHILESKHRNSLYFHLINLNLIEDLSCDFKTIDSMSDEFILNVKLTEKGLQAYQSVIQLTIEFIGFLHNKGIESWRFREKAYQFSLANLFEQGKGLLETCIDTSQAMMLNKALESTESLNISKEEKLFFDNETIDYIFNQLKPNNSRVYLVKSSIENDIEDIKTTAHFNVDYAISDLNLPAFINKGRKYTFEKPRQNPYMPSDTKILKQHLDAYELVRKESPNIDFKFYQNTHFNSPIGECYISFSDPCMLSNARQIAIKRIWLACLQNTLDVKFFDSHLASLHHRVYAHKHGITIHLSGISQRQLYLALDLINEIIKYHAESRLVGKMLEKFQNKAKQQHKLRALNHLFSSLNSLYQSSEITNDEIQKETLSLSIDDVLQQQTQYFKRNFIECLMIGNWSRNQALQFCNILNSRFSTEQSFSKPMVNNPKWQSETHTHYQNADLKESVVIWHYIPIGNNNETNRTIEKTHQFHMAAIALILEKILSYVIFDVIRQKHKMGYALGVGYKPVGRLPGVVMYVESPSHNVEEIYHGLKEVLVESKSLIQQASFSFDKLKIDLIKQVTPQDKKLSQLANRTWLHFEDTNPILGYKDLVKAIENLPLNAILEVLGILSDTNRGQVCLSTSGMPKPIITQFID